MILLPTVKGRQAQTLPPLTERAKTNYTLYQVVLQALSGPGGRLDGQEPARGESFRCGGPIEKNVFTAVNEQSGRQIADSRRVQGGIAGEIEVFRSLGFFETGALQTQSQALAFAPLDFVLQQQL